MNPAPVLDFNTAAKTDSDNFPIFSKKRKKSDKKANLSLRDPNLSLSQCDAHFYDDHSGVCLFILNKDVMS